MIHNLHKPTEEEIIFGMKPETLYNKDFGSGRYFNVKYIEKGIEIQLAAQTLMRVVYIKEKDDVKDFKITKVIRGEETESLQFSKFNFNQIILFLELITKIDLGTISERKINLTESDLLNDDSVRKIKTALMNEGGLEVMEQLIEEGLFESKDLVNTAYRRKSLRIFGSMLNNPDYYKEYAIEEKVNDTKEEKVWQHFFERNEWIFGYGLDYRYQSILQREASLSNTDTDGKNEVTTDFLLGDKKFTTFIEIKKPTTSIFSNFKNRSNSWKLSNELFESVSQILEQKASGLLEFSKRNYNKDGERIDQKAYDSKVILIIGQWNQISEDKDRDIEIKKKTFELFRRDSRNIEILTFDELYERANFIVNGHSVI